MDKSFGMVFDMALMGIVRVNDKAITFLSGDKASLLAETSLVLGCLCVLIAHDVMSSFFPFNFISEEHYNDKDENPGRI